MADHYQYTIEWVDICQVYGNAVFLNKTETKKAPTFEIIDGGIT